MTVNDDGDRTRDIRKLIDSAKKEGQLYNEVKTKFESDDIYQKAYDYIEKIDKKSENPDEEIEKQSLKKHLTSELKAAYKEGDYQSTTTVLAAKPLETMDKVIKLMSNIDFATIKWLDKDLKNQLKVKIDSLKSLINKFEEENNE